MAARANLGATPPRPIKEAPKPSTSSATSNRHQSVAPASGLVIEGIKDAPSESIDFQPRANHPVYCHGTDFLLFEEGDLSIVAKDTAFARRANLVLQHLAAHGRTGVVKGVRGNENQGWRRTPFGGNGGNHFYAWWAPGDAIPVKSLGFPAETIVVRAVRHHDDHRPLTAGEVSEFEEIKPEKLVSASGSDVPLPWTETQLKFSLGENLVRVLIGYPGTGKTTALWNAVITRSAQRSLYITWSRRLTELADEYFRTFGSTDSQVVCRTFEELVDAIMGPRPSSHVNRTVSAERRHFTKLLEELPTRELGGWNQHTDSLFGEIRAHLVGAALPHKPDQLTAPERCRLSDAAYLARRRTELGADAAREVLRIVDLLERKEPIEALFPELERAFKAGRKLSIEGERVSRARAGNHGQTPEGARLKLYRLDPAQFDRIVIDETQDLTPVEAAVPILFSRALAECSDGRPPVVLAAGDEGQTVRPTDFEWGWFKDMLTSTIAAPEETKLELSLRFPRRIAELVNRASELYGTIAKGERPRDMRAAEACDNINETIILCRAEPGDTAVSELLQVAASRPGTALVGLDSDAAQGLPEEAKDALLTPAEAKGCEYQTVVLLNPSSALGSMITLGEAGRRTLKRLWLRSAIDNFRVGLSRATETLILLDIAPADEAGTKEIDRLLAGLGALILSPAEAVEQLQALEVAVDERVQQSIKEAEELLQLNPALALRRARNAIGLLGDPTQPGSVTDATLRRDAHRTMVRVAWELSARPSELPSGVTASTVLGEAVESAEASGWSHFVPAIRAAWDFSLPQGVNRCDAARRIMLSLGSLEPGESWFLSGLTPRVGDVMQAFESGAREHNTAEMVARDAPTLFASLNKHVPGAVPVIEAETEHLRSLAASTLVRAKLHQPAMEVLGMMAEPPLVEFATCEEEIGRYFDAAEHFDKAGKHADALRCWRKAREFGKAAAIADALGNRELQKRLEWLQRIRRAAEERPTGLVTELEEHEKSWLRDLLNNLGR